MFKKILRSLTMLLLITVLTTVVPAFSSQTPTKRKLSSSEKMVSVWLRFVKTNIKNRQKMGERFCRSKDASWEQINLALAKEYQRLHLDLSNYRYDARMRKESERIRREMKAKKRDRYSVPIYVPSPVDPQTARHIALGIQNFIDQHGDDLPAMSKFFYPRAILSREEIARFISVEFQELGAAFETKPNQWPRLKTSVK